MQGGRKWVLIGIIIMISLAACVGIQTAQMASGSPRTQKINSCTTIDKPGQYELTSDITNGGGTGISQSCIEIQSGNVVIDGNGHVIDGRGNSQTTAIRVNTSKMSNVKIANVVITNWHKGIAFQHGSIGEIRNISASSNVYGVSIEDSYFVVTTNSRLENNLVGIKSSTNSLNLKLWGNTITDNNVDRI